MRTLGTRGEKEIRSVLFCVTLLSLAAVPTAAADWHVNPANGHSYDVVKGATWTDCEAQAVALGAHLATIRNASENDWILTTILDPTGEWFAWIGLYQLEGSAEPADGWVWASGEPVIYGNWNPAGDQGPEPNNVGGNENWAEMYSSHYYGESSIFAGFWNDMDYGTAQTPQIGIVESVPEPSGLLSLVCSLSALGGAMGLRQRPRNSR